MAGRVSSMNNKPFKIAMSPEFSKGDLIQSDKNGYLMEVLSVYKMNWFKRLLRSLKIKQSWFIGVKVKYFDRI